MGLAIGEARAHIEPAAVEEDAEAVGGEETKAAGGALDGLDFTVGAFGHGVGDEMSKVGEQAAQVIFERAGDTFDRWESAEARRWPTIGRRRIGPRRDPAAARSRRSFPCSARLGRSADYCAPAARSSPHVFPVTCSGRRATKSGSS